MSTNQKAPVPIASTVAAPIAGLVAVLLGSLLVAVWLVANSQTATAEAEQARIARSAIDLRGRALQKMAVDYGTWDEAYEQLVVSPNADWADANIGHWSFDHFGVDMAFVVTPEGRTTYGAVRGARDARPFRALLTEGIDEVLAGGTAAGEEAGGFGVILADGRPAIAAAVPIRRAAASDPSHAAPPVRLVMVDLIDPSALDGASLASLLPGLRLEAPDFAGSATTPVTTASGFRAATLVWDGERPGDALLRVAIPVWITVAAAFGLLIVLGRRHARTSARLMADAEHQATHDALTDLPNRVRLFQEIDQASRALAQGGPPFAIAYLDLDGFKSVNDRHGHEAGDAVLRAAAGRMRETVGDRGVVARLGGDEFALILFYGARDRRALQALGRRLITAIERPVPLERGGEVRVGATVGLSLAPEDSTDPLMLLRNADQALYAGKRGGKRRVVFHSGTVLVLAGAA